jgi:hypothetical protein
MLDGIYAGKLINVALGLLTAFLVGWAARRCEKGDAAPKDVKSCVPYAMSFFYCSPAILFFSGIAFVEMALTFYLFLALCTFLVYTSVEPSQSWGRIRCAIICGIICGLAAGCKYTAILFGAAPLAIFFLIENSKRGTAAFLPGVRDAAAFLLAALIAFSPWLIRNLVITGNPVFPLLYSLLGGRGWDVAHNAMWVKAHAPGPITLSEFGGSLWGFLANSAFTPLLAFLFIPLLAFRPRVLSAAGRWVFAYAYSYCIFWFLFTHGVDRFLAPALPAFAVLSAVGFAAWQEGWVGKALKGVVVICLVFTLYQGLIVASNLGAFTVGLHPREHENFMRDNTDFYDVYQAIKFLNENSDKAKARVLFLGEARAFYCNADWLAPTVFNTNPLESALRECATPHEAAARLTGQGFTHILVNWSEFQRLQKTYSAFQDFDIRKWEAFQKACFEPLASFGKPDKAGAYPILVYAIRPKL